MISIYDFILDNSIYSNLELIPKCEKEYLPF